MQGPVGSISPPQTPPVVADLIQLTNNDIQELTNSQDGAGQTDQGIVLTYTRQGNINDLSIKCRWDTDYGIGIMNTEMVGIQLFNQT